MTTDRARPPARFPWLARYLAQLDDGLAAYPVCTCKASLYRSWIDAHDLSRDRDGLPSAMVELIDMPEPVNAWMPSVFYNAFCLAVIDRFYKDGAAAARWNHASRLEMFRSPLYRVLMVVMSPARILSGARRRWENFHRGFDFELEHTDTSADFSLLYPPRLHNVDTIGIIVSGVCAALTAAGAKDIRWRVPELTETRARAEARWG